MFRTEVKGDRGLSVSEEVPEPAVMVFEPELLLLLLLLILSVERDTDDAVTVEGDR